MNSSHSMCALALGVVSSFFTPTNSAIAQAENGRARFQDRILREAINQRYSSLRLATVELRDAPLESALEYLHAKAVKTARVSVPNFVLIAPTDQSETRSVDLALKDIPLFEALGYMCDQTGATFSFEPNAVVIARAGAALPRSNLADVSLLCPWMANINLTKIDIRGMPMNDALEYLAEKARREMRDERTINLVLPADSDANAAKTVSLHADNMLFTEAFRYVCLMAEANFVIEPHALVVAGSGKPLPSGDPEEPRGERSPFWKVVIPKLTVQQVSIADAFACLRHAAEKVSPGGSPNFVIQGSLTTAPTEISLNAENLPFFEAVRYLCYLSDSQYRAEQYAIGISPRPKPEPPKDAPPKEDAQ